MEPAEVELTVADASELVKANRKGALMALYTTRMVIHRDHRWLYAPPQHTRGTHAAHEFVPSVLEAG